MTQGRSDPKNLVASIMGYKKEISMAATKHGLSMKVMQRLCMLRLPKRQKI